MFWERIDSAYASDMTKGILSTFNDAEVPPCDLAQAVVDSLSRAAYEAIGFAKYFPELGEPLGAGVDGEWIDHIRQRSVVQLLSLVLSPAAREIATALSSSLDALAEALAHVDAQIESRVRDWREELDATKRIYSYLVEEIKPNEGVAKALLRVRGFVEKLDVESGANWFVAYSYCLDEIGSTTGETVRLGMEHLSSSTIGAFVEQAEGLGEHNRTRLTILGLDADGRAASVAFSRALGIRCYQEQCQIPIRASAIERASVDYSQARGSMDDVLKRYSTLEDSLKGEEYAEERLTCVFQRGSLRAGYGGALARARWRMPRRASKRSKRL